VPPMKRPSALVERVSVLIQDEMESLGAAESLPPETELAARFGVARRSVRSAMSILEQKGLVRRVRGKGTFPTRGRSARGLFRHRARKVAVAGVQAASGFYGHVLEGALNETVKRQGEVVLAGGAPGEEQSEACYRILNDRYIDGVILVALTDQDLIAEVADGGKPVCLIDHYSEKAKIDCVRVDSYGAARLAMDHLHSLGHDRIAYLQPEDPKMNPRRLEGYRAALEAFGLSFRPEWLVAADTTPAGGAQAVMRLLALDASERPTAVMAFSDEMAIGAIQAIMRFGLGVPEDISVVGAGGVSEIVTVGLPDLTCIRFDPLTMGRTAVQYLWERMDGHKPEPRDTVIATAVDIGQSTGRPRVT